MGGRVGGSDVHDYLSGVPSAEYETSSIPGMGQAAGGKCRLRDIRSIAETWWPAASIAQHTPSLRADASQPHRRRLSCVGWLESAGCLQAHTASLVAVCL